MSKMENKWDNLSEYEKQRAYEELSWLIQKRTEKKQANQISIEKRIEKIKRDFPGVRI